jgi:DNA-binding transcriptional LysR family regulator
VDRVRALQYFFAAAEAGSLASAARKLDVSMPAVLKLINALERDLGTVLFHRSPRGLAITPDGQRYLDRCRPLVEALEQARECVGSGTSTRGLVVVGIAPYEEHCIAPHLPRFHGRFPDIELDLRPMRRATGVDAQGVDVFVMPAWQEDHGLVRKILGGTVYRVLASPQYWHDHGIPRHPSELCQHECLVYRTAESALDVWEFERAGELCSQVVSGWLVSASRDVLLDAALGGAGVVRARDVTTRGYTEAGLLVPALTDWTARNAPPPAVFFRPRNRRTARIRAFVDFVSDVFQALESDREPRLAPAQGGRPAWWGTHHARVSTWRAGTSARVRK